MAFAATEKFMFAWEIENFSMCPQKCGEYLSSPVFVVDMLEKTKWRLALYPRGRRTENVLSYFLHRTKPGAESSDITIGFEFTVSSADVTKLTRCIQPFQVFRPKSGYGWENLISRDTIWNNRDDYLPNDILTVKCCMWRVGLDPTQTYVQHTVCPLFRRYEENQAFGNYGYGNQACGNYGYGNHSCQALDSRALFIPKTVSTRTTIVVRKRMITFPIRIFFIIRLTRSFTMPLISPLVDVPSFYLTYFSAWDGFDNWFRFRVGRKDTDSSLQTFVNCKISVNDKYLVEDDHLFKSGVTGDIWTLQLFKLSDQKYLDAVNDDLHLRCELSSSQLGDVCNTFIDVYEALSLKIQCHSLFVLWGGGLCDILRIADWYKDEYLMSKVQNYIKNHTRDVLQSAQWKHFMNTNGSLALDVMCRVLLNR